MNDPVTRSFRLSKIEHAPMLTGVQRRGEPFMVGNLWLPGISVQGNVVDVNVRSLT
jgi:hypothetical protein